MGNNKTLYISLAILAVIAVFSFINYNKNKKINDAIKANAKLEADNAKQQKLAENANITVSQLADLISKQMTKQNEINIKY